MSYLRSAALAASGQAHDADDEVAAACYAFARIMSDEQYAFWAILWLY
jgi:hypothetical protein